jgi:FixJ family two-component response regulator
VLEAGGYDVIVEPFSDEELQRAVLQAAKNFEERSLNESEDE